MVEDEPVPPTATLKIDLDITVDGSLAETIQAHRTTGPRIVRLNGECYQNHSEPKQRLSCQNLPEQAGSCGPNRNMLQLLLLDDHGRVDFNRARINVGFEEWSRLFESP